MPTRAALMDGGTGAELIRRGMPNDRSIWSSLALVERQYHAMLKQVHKDFIEAGAVYITANNYAVIPGYGYDEDSAKRFVSIAGDLAVQARHECKQARTTNVRICGSLPPLLETYRSDLLLSDEAAGQWYNVIADALEPYVDLYLAETLPSLQAAKQALSSVYDRKKDVFVSWCLNSEGLLLSEENPAVAIESLLATGSYQETLKAVLFNCCEPEAVRKALQELQSRGTLTLLSEKGVMLGAYPNRYHGLDPSSKVKFTLEECRRSIREDMSPNEFSDELLCWVDEFGLQLVGGCCAVGPEHIAAVHSKLLMKDILTDRVS